MNVLTVHFYACFLLVLKTILHVSEDCVADKKRKDLGKVYKDRLKGKAYLKQLCNQESE